MNYILLLLTPLILFGKIYDCFLFFNELELLEIRLEEMGDVVDTFVIVESTETFRGNPKPLYFEENKERFAKFAHKIRHVVLDEHFETDLPWSRELWQRAQIARGLTDCSADDVIFISDVDEIIRRTMVRRIAHPIIKKRAESVCAVQKYYAYYLNHFERYWLGSMAASYPFFQRVGACGVRGARDASPKVMEAGWHFSSIGGHQRYLEKLAAYSLFDRDTPEQKNPAVFAAKIDTKRIEPIDDSFPSCIRKNLDRYKEMGFIYSQ